jgi:hypothetical protein
MTMWKISLLRASGDAGTIKICPRLIHQNSTFELRRDMLLKAFPPTCKPLILTSPKPVSEGQCWLLLPQLYTPSIFCFVILGQTCKVAGRRLESQGLERHRPLSACFCWAVRFTRMVPVAQTVPVHVFPCASKINLNTPLPRRQALGLST